MLNFIISRYPKKRKAKKIMENWVTNKLAFFGTERENTEILNFIKGNNENENEIIDFKTIISMPDDVFNDQDNRCNWYRKNWGCGSNACQSEIVENAKSNTVIIFLTSLDAPTPAFKKLINIFPNVNMIFRWADEDMGFNIGEIMFFDGEFQENTYAADKNGNLAWNIYIDVTRNIDCLNLDKNGNWQKKDCAKCELCD